MTHTVDIPFRVEVNKGAPPNTPSDPHLLAFEGDIDHVGEFQSMEVATYRDSQRVFDIGFCSFNHTPSGKRTHIKFQYKDIAHHLVEHDYVLDATLHFLD